MRVEAGGVEQAVDEAFEAGALASRGVEGVAQHRHVGAGQAAAFDQAAEAQRGQAEGGDRGAQLVGGAGEEVVAQFDGLFGAAEEARVVDGHGHAHPQIFGEQSIVFTVDAAGGGGAECHDADAASAREEGDVDGRREAQ